LLLQPNACAATNVLAMFDSAVNMTDDAASWSITQQRLKIESQFITS
jgi:hypothetical protein